MGEVLQEPVRRLRHPAMDRRVPVLSRLRYHRGDVRRRAQGQLVARRGALYCRHLDRRVLLLPGGQIFAYHGLVQEHGPATGCCHARW